MSEAWGLRVRIYGLEVDAETLARDPEKNRHELCVLAAEIARLRRRLGEQTGDHYPVALDLSFGDKTVRVIADNRWEAARIELAWLRAHPGGGSQKQHAGYSVWAAPLLQQLQHRRAS